MIEYDMQTDPQLEYKTIPADEAMDRAKAGLPYGRALSVGPYDAIEGPTAAYVIEARERKLRSQLERFLSSRGVDQEWIGAAPMADLFNLTIDLLRDARRAAP